VEKSTSNCLILSSLPSLIFGFCASCVFLHNLVRAGTWELSMAMHPGDGAIVEMSRELASLHVADFSEIVPTDNLFVFS
jgi:hypothetical protein